MSSLKLVDVKKSYQDIEVLKGIDLDINPGEFVVVVGPSGCGKSSLLRMVAGLESITSGEIYIADKLVNKIEPKFRDIAMVFQNYALYPHMSVYNNIAYGLKMRKVSKEDIYRKVNSIAAMLKIDHLLERKPQALSGGQRQRVAMGRAIVRQPEVFLFDEPLSNLDAKLRMDMRLEIKKLQHKLKITSLYVTHDQVEAMTMADKVMVLNKGVVEQYATPKEIFYHPKTKFVAGFMGSTPMSFLDVELLPKTWIKYHQLQPNIEVGIRADDIMISDDGLKFKVELIESLGDKNLLHGVLESSQSVTVKCSDSYKVNEGELLSISFKSERMHLFEKTTGENITGFKFNEASSSA